MLPPSTTRSSGSGTNIKPPLNYTATRDPSSSTAQSAGTAPPVNNHQSSASTLFSTSPSSSSILTPLKSPDNGDIANQDARLSFGTGPVELRKTGFQEPVRMTRGMFAGRIMRFCLEMAQEPIHGRRKTEKDRRALAHCPIVRLRINECIPKQGGEQWDEEEVDLSTIESSYLVCAAELFTPKHEPLDSPISPRSSTIEPDSEKLPENTRSSQTSSSMDFSRPSSLSTSSSRSQSQLYDNNLNPQPSNNRPGSPLWQVESSAGPGPSSLRSGVENEKRERSSEMDTEGWDDENEHGERNDRATRRRRIVPDAPHLATRVQTSSPRVDRGRGGGRRGSIGQNRGSPSRSGGTSRGHGRAGKKLKTARPGLTRNLYGGLHVPGVKIPTMEGGMGLWFLFADLAVRLEGDYTLRFRCYDLTSVNPPGGPPSPGLVDCFSQTFSIYSPRNFPGLPKTTPLAEHFARQGFKLNTRKSDRPTRADSATKEESEELEDDDTEPPISSERPEPTPLQKKQGPNSHPSSSSSSSLGRGYREGGPPSGQYSSSTEGTSGSVGSLMTLQTATSGSVATTGSFEAGMGASGDTGRGQ